MAESILAAALGFKGKKPKVPDFAPIDINAEQKSALAGNQAILPQSMSMAGQVNMFNQDQILQMLEKAFPGFAGISSKISKNIMSGLSGEIPQDVSTAVINRSAGRGVAGGYGRASGLGRSLTARDLGRTSYDITQQALGSAQSWLAATKSYATPELFSPTAMFISPQQRIEYAFKNQENKFNVDWLRNQIDAMPSAMDRAIGSLMDWVATTGLSAATMGIGGALGGAGGMMGGAGGMMGGGGGGGQWGGQSAGMFA